MGSVSAYRVLWYSSRHTDTDKCQKGGHTFAFNDRDVTSSRSLAITSSVSSIMAVRHQLVQASVCGAPCRMLQNVIERTLQKNLNSLKFYCRIHLVPKIYAPMTTWNLIKISRLHPFSPRWDNCKVFISKKMHVLTSKTVTLYTFLYTRIEKYTEPKYALV